MTRARAAVMTLVWLSFSGVLPSCALRVERGTEVRLRATLGPATAGAVSLADARLSLDELTLVPCADSALEARRWSLASVAHAHHGTVDGRSLLESQFGLGEAADLGALDPPPGRYCSVELTIAPGRLAPMQGRSLTASVTAPRTTPLTAVGSRRFEVPVAPFELNAETPSAELTVRIELAAALAELNLEASEHDLALDLLVALPAHAEALVVVDPPA